jgi:hypothetical protein
MMSKKEAPQYSGASFFDKLKQTWGISPTFVTCGRVYPLRSTQGSTLPGEYPFIDSPPPPAVRREVFHFSVLKTIPPYSFICLFHRMEGPGIAPAVFRRMGNPRENQRGPFQQRGTRWFPAVFAVL